MMINEFFEWNIWIGSILGSYLTTTIACWLSLRNIAFTNYLEFFSFLLSFTILVVELWIPIMIYLVSIIKHSS